MDLRYARIFMPVPLPVWSYESPGKDRLHAGMDLRRRRLREDHSIPDRSGGDCRIYLLSGVDGKGNDNETGGEDKGGEYDRKGLDNPDLFIYRPGKK